MIKQETKEYSEDGLAVRTMQITLFGVPIYRFKKKKTSTNKAAVAQLTTVSKPAKVKGFSNENKD